MKKLIAYLLLSVFAFSVLAGCGESSNPSVAPQKREGDFIVSLFEVSDSSGIAHRIDLSLTAGETYIDEKAKSVSRISVGESYIDVKYENSNTTTGGFSKRHNYKTPEGYFVSTNDEGKISSLFRGSCKDPEINQRVLTQEECVQVAIDFFGTIANVNDYEMEVELDRYGRLYNVAFNKTVDGFLCADKALFGIEKSGYLYSFSSTRLGQMKTDADTGFDRSEVEQKVLARLDREYASAKKIYDEVQYREIEYVLSVNEKNTYVLFCTVTVDLISYREDGGKLSMAEGLVFLIQ